MFESLPPKQRNPAVVVLRTWLSVAVGAVPLYAVSVLLIHLLRNL